MVGTARQEVGGGNSETRQTSRYAVTSYSLSASSWSGSGTALQAGGRDVHRVRVVER